MPDPDHDAGPKLLSEILGDFETFQQAVDPVGLAGAYGELSDKLYAIIDRAEEALEYGDLHGMHAAEALVMILGRIALARAILAEATPAGEEGETDGTDG